MTVRKDKQPIIIGCYLHISAEEQTQTIALPDE